jgi:hypothetical protein
MSEYRVVYYDPDAPEISAARAVLLAPILVLAHGRDRGGLSLDDIELFNMEVNEMLGPVQADSDVAVRYIMELVLSLNLAIASLATLARRSNEAVAHHLLLFP